MENSFNPGSPFYRRLLALRPAVTFAVFLFSLVVEIVENIQENPHSAFAFESLLPDLIIYGVGGSALIWLVFTWLIKRTSERDEAEAYLRGLYHVSFQAATSTDIEVLVNTALHMPESVLGPVATSLIMQEYPDGPWILAGAHRLSSQQQTALQASLSAAGPCTKCSQCTSLTAATHQDCAFLPAMQEEGARPVFTSVACLCLSKERPCRVILNIYLTRRRISPNVGQALNSMATGLALALDYAHMRNRESQMLGRIQQAVREQKGLVATLRRFLSDIAAAHWAEAGVVLLMSHDGAESDLIPVASWPEEWEYAHLAVAARQALEKEAVVTSDGIEDQGQVMAIPLKAENLNLGALVLVGYPLLSPSQFGFLNIAIEMMALVIRNSQLYAELQSQAVLEERSRVAREVHDGLAQSLGFFNFKIQQIDRLLTYEQWAEAQQALRELREGAQDLYAEVRLTIQDLHWSGASTRPLAARLREYGATFASRTGLDVSVTVDEGLELSSQMAAHLMRIAQEALSNVHQHAQAQHAQVRLWKDSGGITLEVNDNGIGLLQTPPEAPEHFGLRIIRERAESMGGQLRLRSQPGQSTTLQVIVPTPHTLAQSERS